MARSDFSIDRFYDWLNGGRSLSHRVTVHWPDGHISISQPLPMDIAKDSYKWTCNYQEAVKEGATVVLQRRFVEEWKDEESKVLGDPRSKGMLF